MKYTIQKNFQPNPVTVYDCELCDFSYKSKTAFRLHEKVAHKDCVKSDLAITRFFICSACKKHFDSAIKLFSHNKKCKHCPP